MCILRDSDILFKIIKIIVQAKLKTQFKVLTYFGLISYVKQKYYDIYHCPLLFIPITNKLFYPRSTDVLNDYFIC